MKPAYGLECMTKRFEQAQTRPVLSLRPATSSLTTTSSLILEDEGGIAPSELEGDLERTAGRRSDERSGPFTAGEGAIAWMRRSTTWRPAGWSGRRSSTGHRGHDV